MKVNTKVLFLSLGSVILKFPLISEATPTVVPLIRIVTPGRGCPLSSVTVPFTTFGVLEVFGLTTTTPSTIE